MPATACRFRLAAVLDGRFYFDHVKRGWFWADARQTKHQPWTRCPWCDGPLATPAVMRQRMERSLEEIFGVIRQADGADLVGEEGG